MLSRMTVKKRCRRHGYVPLFFFFQAEDGIRDVAVTGVQTCALPIYPADSGDAGSILSEADRTEAILLSARDQRDGVLAALSRIDEASYGQCVDCGHEIPEGRLDARPDAARCVGCQSKWAKHHR